MRERRTAGETAELFIDNVNKTVVVAIITRMLGEADEAAIRTEAQP